MPQPEDMACKSWDPLRKAVAGELAVSWLLGKADSVLGGESSRGENRWDGPESTAPLSSSSPPLSLDRDVSTEFLSLQELKLLWSSETLSKKQAFVLFFVLFYF